MKSYPATSITRLSGDILMDAAHEPVMITRYRKPGYVIMTADKYTDLLRQGSAKDDWLSLNPDGEEMPHIQDRDDIQDLKVLQLFADRLIDRAEAEDRTGLYFSEILIRLGELGIKRKSVEIYEGMPAGQRKLFDEVFKA